MQRFMICCEYVSENVEKPEHFVQIYKRWVLKHVKRGEDRTLVMLLEKDARKGK